MTLIDFKQLCILDTVLASCENMAKRATVRRHFTSSRFIVRVNRRFCKLRQIRGRSQDKGYIREASYIQAVALRASLIE